MAAVPIMGQCNTMKQPILPRRTAMILLVLAVGFLAFAIVDSHRRKLPQDDETTLRPAAAMADKNWMPNETVTGTILAANFAQEQRDWALANLYLDKLSNAGSNDPVTLLRMMLLAVSAGQFDRAADYAQKLEKASMGKDAVAEVGDGRDLASLVLLAQRVRAGDLPAAEKLLMDLKSTALVAFVQPVLVNWLKAGQKQQLDGGTDGLSLLQALHRGLAAEWAGQTDVANRVFDSLARIPLTPTGTMMLAAYNIRQGRADAARVALNEALRQNPLDMDVKALLEAINQGQTPVLKPEWSYHLQGVTAGVALAFRDLAQMMMSDRAADSALVFAQLGRMIRNDVPGLSLLVGSIFYDQHRFDDAANVFSSVQPGDADYTSAQIRLSELRAEENEKNEAIDILEDLMNKNPSPRVAYALGEIYRENKDFKKAVHAYDQAIELSGGKADDDLWSVYYVRAMALDELGEWDKTESDLKTALTYRPDNPHVLNYLGYSWADRNINLIEARDMITRALAAAPTDPYITDSLGWVYFREGDFDQATVLLERAVSLKPYDPVLNDHLGDVYEKVGRTLEARYQWRRALDYADAARDQKLITDVTSKLEDSQEK